jgi:DNA-binding NarL/FixJ family response regulator
VAIKRKAAWPHQILIVDDHPVAREGLRARVEKQPDLRVCAETADINEAFRLVAATNPDLAIIDLTLKTGHGLELVKRIKSRYPKTRMLVWSMHPENLYAERALQAGAMGYISKEDATENIIAAIHCILDGQVYLSATMSQRLLKKAVAGRVDEAPIEGLSDRELQTFELVGQGLSTDQIAAKMHLSPKTILTYRSRIKEKLKVEKASELVQRAIQWHMESP